MLALPLTLVALATTTSGTAPAALAKPLVPLEQIFTPEDYPAEALAKGREGNVRVLIKVDEQGAVSDCIVEESSGVPSLDVQTCRVIWLRAKFKPAVGKGSKALAREISKDITWRLEKGEPAPIEPWGMHRVLRYTHGKSPQCKVEVSGILVGVPGATKCVTRPDLAQSYPGTSPSRTIEQVEEHEFALTRPILGARSGDRILGLTIIEFEIGPDGRPTSCSILHRQGEIPAEFQDMCADLPENFVRPRPRKGTPASLKAYYLVGAYVRTLKETHPDTPAAGSSQRH